MAMGFNIYVVYSNNISDFRSSILNFTFFGAFLKLEGLCYPKLHMPFAYCIEQLTNL